MADHRIEPEKITRPFQLLAAWLLGLIIVDGGFLVAAAKISYPSWAPTALVVAAIINVPLFLYSIFLLQTRFRPEMQEDIYYSRYLERQDSLPGVLSHVPDVDAQADILAEKIVEQLGPDTKPHIEPITGIIVKFQIHQLAQRLGASRTLSELFLAPDAWPSMVLKYEKSSEFTTEIKELMRENLVRRTGRGYKSIRLTDLGRQVAEISSNRGFLYAQFRKDVWEEEHPALPLSSAQMSGG